MSIVSNIEGPMSLISCYLWYLTNILGVLSLIKRHRWPHVIILLFPVVVSRYHIFSPRQSRQFGFITCTFIVVNRFAFSYFTFDTYWYGWRTYRRSSGKRFGSVGIARWKTVIIPIIITGSSGVVWVEGIAELPLYHGVSVVRHTVNTLHNV